MAPVVSVTLGVLGPLLVKLADLLAGKFGRVRGVRREILSLQSELTSMHAALEEYTMLEDPGVQVKAWISLLRELAYDTEDCIDKFIRCLGKRGRRGSFKELFRNAVRFLKTLNSRSGIADQIDELKARFRHVKELKDCYKLSDTSCSKTGHVSVDPRLRALFAEDAHLVGLEGPRDDLVQWMLKEENSSTKQLRVLSIVGFGGLGKTTLANQVYRKIQGRFDCRAFVSVSQKPDIKKIIKDVICKVSYHHGFTKDIDTWDEMTSIAKLRELLQNKRYLIVIDDIWSTPAWEAIKCVFPENNYSSRIIVTTRIVDVARSCCSGGDDYMYEMEALSNIHSKILFSKRIFGFEDRCPDMLKVVSKEILKKCGGLPLAIISIASLLANIPVVKEKWEKIIRSINSAMDKNQSLEGMSSILSLSYNYLPPNLKTCLLYLSAFPEDHVIHRNMLVRRWIAEGFISQERGQSQQDVANRYFYELINQSMVQPVGIEHDGTVNACRVHDMMLEILISKSDEDNFITVVGSGQASLTNRHGVIRRLSVQHIDPEIASTLANEDLTHVRSLTITTSSGSLKYFPSLVKFQALRVLDFGSAGHGLEEYIMKDLAKLFKLRYLKLGDKEISKLPPGIVMLHDLETLDLQGTAVEELPAGFVQLTKLQHLITENEIKVPNGIEVMINLKVISRLDISRSPRNAVEGLGNLANLNRLDVRLEGGLSEEHKRREKMFLSSLCKLGNNKLQYLTITRESGSLDFLDSWSPLPTSLQTFNTVTTESGALKFLDSLSPVPTTLLTFNIPSSSCFTNFPKWITPALTNLSFLCINLTELTVEGLHTLGELPALSYLHLKLDTGPKDGLTVQGFGFPSLNVFITSSGRATYFMFVKGAMPKLEILHVVISAPLAKTYGFYSGIEHLPCLKRVQVWIPSEGATPSDDTPAAAASRKQVLAAFLREAAANPNRPPISFIDEMDNMNFFALMEKSRKRRMAISGTG